MVGVGPRDAMVDFGHGLGLVALGPGYRSAGSTTTRSSGRHRASTERDDGRDVTASGDDQVEHGVPEQITADPDRDRTHAGGLAGHSDTRQPMGPELGRDATARHVIR